MLDGTNAPGVNNRGLLYNSVDSGVIQGLAIVSFASAGIYLVGSDANTIANNYLGVEADGVTAGGNNSGVLIISGDGNQVINNVASGNTQRGIDDLANNTVIEGNKVGTDAGGTVAVPNAAGITANGEDATIENNVVSGNSGVGISVGFNGDSGTTIASNLIGTDVTGTQDLGNTGDGVLIGGGVEGVRVGLLGGGNTIAFNGGGVQLAGGAGRDNRILQNSIFDNLARGIDLSRYRQRTRLRRTDPGDADTGPNNTQNFPDLTAAIRRGNAISITGRLNSTASTAFRIEFFASPECDTALHGEGQTFLHGSAPGPDPAGT